MCRLPERLLLLQAVTYFLRALKLNRNYLSAWTLMGHEYVEMKNIPAAIGKALEEAVCCHPMVAHAVWSPLLDSALREPACRCQHTSFTQLRLRELPLMTVHCFCPQDGRSCCRPAGAAVRS